MAETLLGAAVKMAASAASSEMSLLIGVRNDIRFMKDELQMIQAFLVSAQAQKEKNILLKVWEEQVRDLSYDIENCLGEFMVHVGSQSLSQLLLKLKDRHRIAMEIRGLKSRVQEVGSRNTRYSIVKPFSSSTEDERDSSMEIIHNCAARNVDEVVLVGFIEPKMELLKLLDVHSNDGPVKVIFVVGMGGLGKTTITRKVYESKDYIANQFSCYAWVTVSQSLDKIEFLKDMIRQLLGPKSLDQFVQGFEGKRAVEVVHLATHLLEELKDKRYIIVIDDLWTIDVWNWIKSTALPIINNEGSRIVVTTRDVGLAIECSAQLIYHVKRLHMEDAVNLLLRKTDRTYEVMERGKMNRLVESVVKKCGGLPLAILLVGGLLASKDISEWESIDNQIPFDLECNPCAEALRKIVNLSYNHLPSHLKPCFLYLSIFPKNFEIQRSRLVDRWIAEGLVKSRDEMTLKDVAESYFHELISRSMIQPSRVNIEGKVKGCRVHDIVRDIAISISKREGFVCLTEDNVTSVGMENFRHIAYHGSKCRKIRMDWSNLLSLTVFGQRPTELAPSLCSPEMRRLITLDMQDAKFGLTQNDIKSIGLLRHLKYVNIRYHSTIYKLPRSIGRLQGLQTLDIRNTHITTLPSEISDLRRLHTIRGGGRGYYEYFYPEEPKKCMLSMLCMPIIAELCMDRSSRWSVSRGVKLPRGIGKLEELQILEVVDINRSSSEAIKELGELVQLRKLKVVTGGATEQKCKILSATIQKLSSLKSLRLDATKRGTLKWMDSISSPPLLLSSLKLVGSLVGMPDWIGNLTYLVKIHIWRSQLKEGKFIEILGALPNLMLLYLGKDSYVGEKLVFRVWEFPKLRQLAIERLDELREVKFEEGTSPLMERIEIGRCRLESGIIGIKHLPRLNEIRLGCEVARLGLLQFEVDAHPNYPVLRLEGPLSWHDLGDIKGLNEEMEAVESLPESVAGGRSPVVMSTTSIRECSDVQDEEDDFCSCNSIISDGSHVEDDQDAF